MDRSQRPIAIAAGLAAVLVVAGVVVGAGLIDAPGGQPVTAQSSPEPEKALSAEKVQKILDRLSEAGISATSAQFESLATKHGVGGAVRILAFADAAGKTDAQITAILDAGKGWGEIRRELGISIGPGIGWIMGHGHAKGD